MCVQRKVFVACEKVIKVFEVGVNDDFLELGNPLKGHRECVKAMCVGRNGSQPEGRLYSGGMESTIHIWDTLKHVPLGFLKGHTGIIQSLHIAGQHLFSGGGDKDVRVWDIYEGKPVATWEGHKAPITSLVSVYGRDSKRRLFSGGQDNEIRVWDLATLDDEEERNITIHPLRGHTKGVKALVATPATLFSGSADLSIRVWDIGGDYSCIHVIKGLGKICYALHIVGGKLFSACADGCLMVWDVAQYHHLTTLKGHTGSVRAFAVDRITAANTDLKQNKIYSGGDDKGFMVWAGPNPDEPLPSDCLVGTTRELLHDPSGNYQWFRNRKKEAIEEVEADDIGQHGPTQW